GRCRRRPTTPSRADRRRSTSAGSSSSDGKGRVMGLQLTDEQLELLYRRSPSPLAVSEPPPSPLTDEERDLLYGPMRTPVETPSESDDADATAAPRPRRHWLHRVFRGAVRLLTSTIGAAVAILVLVVTIG